MDPHADLMLWKRASGRSKGQPAASDCSGKAGMVAGGVGSRVWVVGSGFGLGKTGREDVVIKRKVEKSMMMMW